VGNHSNIATDRLQTNIVFKSNKKRKMKNILKRITASYANFTHGIMNFWKWKKVIWNDRWWDHDFIYELMLFKLKDMESHWGKNTNGQNDKDVKIVLQSLINDLKRLQENDFASKERQEIDLEYGKLDFVLQKNNDNTRSTLLLAREKETSSNRDEIKKRVTELYNLEYERRIKIKKHFFDTLRDNIETFWD